MSGWKKWALIAAGVIVALIAAYSAGRFGAPSKIHTVDITHTVVKTVEVVKVVTVKGKTEVVHVDRVITKEGEVRERIVTRTVEVEKKTDDRDKREDSDTKGKADSVTTNDAPRLTVMVLGGVDLSPAWQPIPNAGVLALGVGINYRVAGPFVVGAWGLHTGAFGVGVGLQF